MNYLHRPTLIVLGIVVTVLLLSSGKHAPAANPHPAPQVIARSGR